MIPLLIIGGAVSLLALSAHKTNPVAASAGPATTPSSPSSSAPHPANNGLEGIFTTPEMENLYSSARTAVSYTPPAAIPIQPASKPALSSLPPTLQSVLGVKTAVASPATATPLPATATRIPLPSAPLISTQRFSTAQRQRVSLL